MVGTGDNNERGVPGEEQNGGWWKREGREKNKDDMKAKRLIFF